MGSWHSSDDLKIKSSSPGFNRRSLPPHDPPRPPLTPDVNQKYIVYLKHKNRDGNLSRYRLDVDAPAGAVFVTG
jgi:hypothetical protein